MFSGFQHPSASWTRARQDGVKGGCVRAGLVGYVEEPVCDRLLCLVNIHTADEGE